MTGSQVVAEARRSVSTTEFIELPKTGLSGSERCSMVNMRKQRQGQYSQERLGPTYGKATLKAKHDKDPSSRFMNNNFSSINLKSREPLDNAQTTQ